MPDDDAMKPSDVVAVVLMGGTSSRMWPLRDKHLLRFAGRRLLATHLAHLRGAGIRRFILSGNEGNVGVLREEAASLAAEVIVVKNSGPPGMAGAVLDAISQLGESDRSKPVYVTQPHDVVEAGLHQQVVRAGTEGNGYAHLAGCVKDQYFPGGYLVLEGRNIVEGAKIVDIVEKPGEGSEPSNVVTIVAHFFADARPLYQELERQTQQSNGDDLYERSLSRLMSQHPFALVPYRGAWRSIKYPWQVLDVMSLLLKQIEDGEVSLGPGYRQLDAGVFVGEEVTIHPGSHLVAPVVLGRAVVVGHNALIRASMVGDHCVVGFGSEIARSYLGEGCELHANYIGDSVLDQQVLLGFGAVSANFRLDGKTVRSAVRDERIDSERTKLGTIVGAGAKLGVGVNIMPGVKIGAGAVIGPGQIVAKDVADNASIIPGRND